MLAELAKGQLRKKLPQLREALAGRFRAHHALLVGELLAHIEYLEDAIERLSQEVEQAPRPFRSRSRSWTPSPGVDHRAAEVILAEIGADMTRFPTAATWPPGLGAALGTTSRPASDGSGRTAQGLQVAGGHADRGRHTRPPAARAPTSPASTLGSEVGGATRRPSARWRHSLLVIAYHVLRRGRPYAELGPDYLLRRDNADAYAKRLVRQLERLGHKVTLERLPLTA